MKNIIWAKDRKVSKAKQMVLDGIKEAIEEVKLAKQGKIKLKSAEQLLREL